MDLLRSVLKSGVYQIADEEGVLKRKAEEKYVRKTLGKRRQEQSKQNKRSIDEVTDETEHNENQINKRHERDDVSSEGMISGGITGEEDSGIT